MIPQVRLAQWASHALTVSMVELEFGDQSPRDQAQASSFCVCSPPASAISQDSAELPRPEEAFGDEASSVCWSMGVKAKHAGSEVLTPNTGQTQRSVAASDMSSG